MSITPESVRELLSSENIGDRLRGVNHIRELEKSVGFELLQVPLADSNARVRYSAASQIDTLGTEDLESSLKLLRDLLKDPEPDVQAAAADCLGALKLVEAFEELEQLYYQTPEWLVQFSIIATLGDLGDSRCFELLKQALRSENTLIQTAAISSLGELGDPQAVPLLIPYTTNADWQVRYRTVQALSRLGGAEAKSVLAGLINDEVEAIADEAKRALD